MKRFERISFGRKVFLYFMLTSLITVAIGTVGILSLRNIEESNRKKYAKTTAPLADLVAIATSFQNTRVDLRNLILATSAPEQRDFARRLDLLALELTRSSTAFGRSISTEEGRRRFRRFTDAHEAYQPYQERMIELAKEGRPYGAITLLHGTAGQAASSVQNAIDELVSIKLESAKELADQSTNNSRNTMIDLLALGLLSSFGLSVFVSWRLSCIIEEGETRR